MKNKSPNLSSVGHLLRLFRDFTKRAFLKSSTVISQDDTAVKLYKRTANGRHRSQNNLPLPSNTEAVEGIFTEKNLCTLTLSVCIKLVCWFLNTGVTPKPCCVWANLVRAFVYAESLCLSKSCGALPRRVWNDPCGWKPFQTAEGTPVFSVHFLLKKWAAICTTAQRPVLLSYFVEWKWTVIVFRNQRFNIFFDPLVSSSLLEKHCIGYL